MQLYWKSLPYSRDKFMVVGTELSQAIVPGCNSRYAIVEVRRYDENKQADRRYSIRDAATVTDEDVKNGKRPKQIASFNYEDEAIEYCKKLLDSHK